MADRAMMFCPTCRDMATITGNQVLKTMELSRDMDMIRCPNGHTFPDYNQLMAMNPEKIKLIPQEKPQPHDVKIDVWVDKGLWDKFREKYPHQVNSTVSSILSLYVIGEDPVILDGGQAKTLRGRGIRNGAEMIAAVELADTLQGEIDGLKTEIKTIRSLVREQLRDGDDA